MIDGVCDAAFDGVREVFEASFVDGQNLGACVAVSVGGRMVVDLWGGVADERAGRSWERDTTCVTFSCTKAITAAAALLLAERGVIDLDRPVADRWPAFGGHGKDTTTAVHLLTHQAGLPAFDRPISAEEAVDPVAMADHLAGQTPDWPAGTAHGYHAITFGWLVGELIRRHSGMSVGDFVRAEIGPQLHIGVDEAELAGIARISAGRPLRVEEPAAPPDVIARLVAATQQPDSPMQRSTANPAASFNNPVLLKAGWPAAGLVTTARGLADFYARLVAGEILDLETLRFATRERVRGLDRTLVMESAFGLGFMLPSSNMFLPEPARANAFGHPGASGALGIADPAHELAIAFIPNVSRPMLGDRRGYRIVEAVYAALGTDSTMTA